MNGFKQKYLKKGPQPYFIAEIGINHNGRMELAKRMIDASAKAGADAVKFQKRDVSMLVLPGVMIPVPTGYLSKDEHDMPSEKKAFGTWTYPDMRLELTDKQHLELWKHAESKGLDYIVSPWEEGSIEFLVKHKAKVIKLASIDATNYHFCETIASKGVPVIVSTGMSDYSDLQQTWEIFAKARCPMMFLHCTSAYPCPIEDKHLRCIPVLQQMFEGDVGFSGHGIGFEGTLGAVAFGANVIEKHVTLSRKMSGPDQAASLEFHELEQLIAMSRNMNLALGHIRKRFLPSEAVLHGVLVKRIVTAKPVKAGEALKRSMVRTVVTKDTKGFLPNQYYRLLGATVHRNLPANHVLLQEDISLVD